MLVKLNMEYFTLGALPANHNLACNYTAFEVVRYSCNTCHLFFSTLHEDQHINSVL